MSQSYLRKRLVHFNTLDKLLCRQISTRSAMREKQKDTRPQGLSLCSSEGRVVGATHWQLLFPLLLWEASYWSR